MWHRCYLCRRNNPTDPHPSRPLDYSSHSDHHQSILRKHGTQHYEYTHNVAYHVYAGWIGGGPSDYYSQGAAMDEGLSDYFACTNNNDATLGEDVGVSRNLDNNTYTWNPNL